MGKNLVVLRGILLLCMLSMTGCECDTDSDCTDNDMCSGEERCVDMKCVAGTPLECDDGNVCTDDSCDPQGGCLYVNNTSACEDGNACTEGDQCANGVCEEGTSLSCDDSNLCTTDTCDQESGCIHDPVPGCVCVALEEWISLVNQGKGSGNWSFCKGVDSAVVVEGEWIYNTTLFNESEEIRCPFTGGLATISGQSVSFTASGTAQITSNPSQTSPFTLVVEGTTNNGQAGGSFTISFTQQYWPPEYSGGWTATRESGSGITE